MMSNLDFFVIGALAGAAWRELINVMIKVISAGEEWKLMWRTTHATWRLISNWISSTCRSYYSRPSDPAPEASGGDGEADQEHTGSLSGSTEGEATAPEEPSDNGGRSVENSAPKRKKKDVQQ